MTVGELKEFLKDKDDTTIVLRADNSGGYEKIYDVREEYVRDNFAPAIEIINENGKRIVHHQADKPAIILD